MSQRIRQIYGDLVIMEQCTEPHIPWQKSAELNGIKYFKSHAQVLLDRIGAPDSIWFLTQDYLVNVYNLSENHQIDYKIPEQVSRERTRYFPYPDVLLV
jgi:hypothetical protein